MSSDRLLVRVLFDERSYILLSQLEGDAWRLTRRLDQHTATEGTGRQAGADALACAIQELVQEQLQHLDQEAQAVQRGSDAPPGFRPGYRKRTLAKLANRRQDFLSRIRACALEAGCYLGRAGWPVPAPIPVTDAPSIEFAKEGLCAYPPFE